MRPYLLKPYRSGCEPADCVRVVIQITRIGYDRYHGRVRYSVRVDSVDIDGRRTRRFEAEPYTFDNEDTARAMAEDVIAFAAAFVDRPEDFGRADDDAEQAPENGAWWREHGTALMRFFTDRE